MQTLSPQPTQDTDAAGQSVPLCVDMDGTLLRTDLLYETLLRFIAQSPLNILLVLRWILRGRADLKARLAERATPDLDLIPLNPECVQHIDLARSHGRQVILVSASHRTYVAAVAQKLGLFDAWYGSDGAHNLKGAAKAAFLEERFGHGGFDYIGDSTADMPVWRAARRAIFAGRSTSLGARVKAEFDDALILGACQSESTGRALLRAMRPHQWLKNLLLFIPLLMAHSTNPALWIAVCGAFIVFSLVASSVYLLNDLLDIPSDRAHPRKSKRPLASGALPVEIAAIGVPVLLIGSFAIAALLLPLAFVAVLGLYYLSTLSYSLGLKRVAVLDILILAGLYAVRVFAGGMAASIALSPWLILFSIFIFLSLAATKRQAELVDLVRSGKEMAKGRGYTVNDTPSVANIAVASGFISVLVFALYVNTPAVTMLYESPTILWVICPVLLYWLGRVQLLTSRGEMHDDPVIFAVRDRISLLCGAIAGTVIVLGLTI